MGYSGRTPSGNIPPRAGVLVVFKFARSLSSRKLGKPACIRLHVQEK